MHFGSRRDRDCALRQRQGIPSGHDALQNRASLEMNSRELIVDADAPVGCGRILQNADQVLSSEDLQVTERKQQGLTNGERREPGCGMLDISGIGQGLCLLLRLRGRIAVRNLVGVAGLPRREANLR